MNHEYSHCMDYTEDCPKECFRGQLVRDLDRVPISRVSWVSFKGTDECKKERGDGMNRIKGRYVAQLIIDIDTPYEAQDDRPIAEVKERFRTMLTPLIRENIQKGVGSYAAVNLVEQYLDVYEVTEK